MEARVGIELPRRAKRENVTQEWALFKLTFSLLPYTRRIQSTDTFTDSSTRRFSNGAGERNSVFFTLLGFDFQSGSTKTLQLSVGLY